MLAPSSSIPVPSQTRAIVLLAVAGFASQAMVRSAYSLLPQIAGGRGGRFGGFHGGFHEGWGHRGFGYGSGWCYFRPYRCERPL